MNGFFCAEILFQGGWNISLSSIHCKGFHFSVILLRRVLRTRANEAGLLLVLKITKEGWSVLTFTVLQSQFIVVIKDWQNVLVFVCLLTCSSEQIKLHLISMLLCKEFALAVSSLPHLSPPPQKKSHDRSMFKVFFFITVSNCLKCGNSVLVKSSPRHSTVKALGKRETGAWCEGRKRPPAPRHAQFLALPTSGNTEVA